MILSDGPECPHCGCLDSEELSQKEWFGKILSIRLCTACHSQFTAEMPGAGDDIDVPAPEIPKKPRGPGVMTYKSDLVRCVCPECGEDNPRITKSIPRANTIIRYHLCSKGHHSRSVEKAVKGRA